MHASAVYGVRRRGLGVVVVGRRVDYATRSSPVPSSCKSVLLSLHPIIITIAKVTSPLLVPQVSPTFRIFTTHSIEQWFISKYLG